MFHITRYMCQPFPATLPKGYLYTTHDLTKLPYFNITLFSITHLLYLVSTYPNIFQQGYQSFILPKFPITIRTTISISNFQYYHINMPTLPIQLSKGYLPLPILFFNKIPYYHTYQPFNCQFSIIP